MFPSAGLSSGAVSIHGCDCVSVLRLLGSRGLPVRTVRMFPAHNYRRCKWVIIPATIARSAATIAATASIDITPFASMIPVTDAPAISTPNVKATTSFGPRGPVGAGGSDMNIRPPTKRKKHHYIPETVDGDHGPPLLDVALLVICPACQEREQPSADEQERADSPECPIGEVRRVRVVQGDHQGESASDAHHDKVRPKHAIFLGQFFTKEETHHPHEV
jgi:hypothetical protein